MRQPVQEDPAWPEIFLRRLPGNAFGRWNYITNFWRGTLVSRDGSRLPDAVIQVPARSHGPPGRDELAPALEQLAPGRLHRRQPKPHLSVGENRLAPERGHWSACVVATS